MSRTLPRPKPPVEVVGKSQRGLLDAVRQALSGASRTMGSLDRCDATILPQIVGRGPKRRFQILLSVTKRPNVPTGRGS